MTLTERRLTIELVFSVKVSIVEDLDGNLLLVVILCLEVGVIGGDEFFDVDRGDGDLFVFSLAIDAHESPISDSQGDTKNDDEENVRLDPTMGDDGQDTFQHPRDTKDNCGQMEVIEVPVALCHADQRGIFYGWGLGYLHGRIDHGCRA